MKRGVQIRRKILVAKEHGITNRGNPEGFWVLQECGHVNYRYFTLAESINMFLVSINKSPAVRCIRCSTGRIDVRDIDIELCDFFPPKVRLLQRKIKEYREGLESLLEATPREFGAGEFNNTTAYKYRHLKVVEEHSSVGKVFSERKKIKPWPGSHQNVYTWYELEDGHAVGWNENPSRGWSFPVVRLKEEEE